MVVQDYRKFDFSSGHVCGVLVQYPNTDGQINDYTDMITNAHKNGVSCEVTSFLSHRFSIIGEVSP